MLKKHKLFSNAIKMVKKMVFAFKFQEQTFPLEFLKSPLANQVCMKGLKRKHHFNNLILAWSFFPISP